MADHNPTVEITVHHLNPDVKPVRVAGLDMYVVVLQLARGPVSYGPFPSWEAAHDWVKLMDRGYQAAAQVMVLGDPEFAYDRKGGSNEA